MFIEKLDVKEGKTVEVRDSRKRKTSEQLGALFGVWATYVMEQTGYTKDEVHKQWKANFLCRIYCEEPHGTAQENWVDLLFHLQEKGDWEGVNKHSKTISLKLASVLQMRHYMNEIQGYYISNRMPLPIPERFEKLCRRG
ncbi:MAG: hypothetical protein R8M45_01950 [Ghiorsea sp.]